MSPVRHCVEIPIRRSDRILLQRISTQLAGRDVSYRFGAMPMARYPDWTCRISLHRSSSVRRCARHGRDTGPRGRDRPARCGSRLLRCLVARTPPCKAFARQPRSMPGLPGEAACDRTRSCPFLQNDHRTVAFAFPAYRSLTLGRQAGFGLTASERRSGIRQLQADPAPRRAAIVAPAFSALSSSIFQTPKPIWGIIVPSLRVIVGWEVATMIDPLSTSPCSRKRTAAASARQGMGSQGRSTPATVGNFRSCDLLERMTRAR